MTDANPARLPRDMPAFYAETHFRTPTQIVAWPVAFAIITAYATTGESWSAARNAAADAALEAALREMGLPIQRITGYSPVTLHAEPGWAAPLSFAAACEIGLRFRQDAIYYVKNGMLYVSHCDRRRRLIPLGPFLPRLHVAK